MGVWVGSLLECLCTTPQRPTKGPQWKVQLFEAALPNSVHQRETRRGLVGLTGHQGYSHPSLINIVNALVYLATITLDGMGWQCVMGSMGHRVHRHLIHRKIEGSLGCKVSDRDNESAGRRGGCPSTQRKTVDEVSPVRVEFSLMNFNDFI